MKPTEKDDDGNVLSSGLFYYNYLPNDSNRKVKTGNPVYIDLDKMYFTMPENEVMICAKTVRNNAEITEFVMGGVSGFINQNNRTIEVNLETSNSSVDLTNLVPDSIKTDYGTEIKVKSGEDSLDYKKPQDFSGGKRVTYTVTAPSGRIIEYTVTVTEKKDGYITGFNVLGFDGKIEENGNSGIITLTVPQSLNLNSVKPSIVWSGTKITPSTGAAVNLTSGGTYTVTSSAGTQRVYTIIIVKKEQSDTALNESMFYIRIGDTKCEWSIDKTTKEIKTEVPYGTDLTEDNCTLTKFDWTGAKKPGDWEVGHGVNLTKANFINIIEGGREVSYSIVVKEGKPKIAKLNQFRLYTFDGTIGENTVTVNLPAGYPTENIRPSVVNFTGKSIAIDGDTDWAKQRDYINGASIVVTAYDGTTTYTLTVNVGQ